MDAGDDDDRARLLDAVLRNPVNRAILDRAPQLGLSDWWVAGGAIFQTVWNVLDGRPPTAGINDYDLFYFDGADLSAKAEADVQRRVDGLFSDVEASIETCNQARVHLWHQAEFGRPGVQFSSSRDAIDHFVGTTCAYAVGREPDSSLRVYAPFGYRDLFDQHLRPNPKKDARAVYERKAARWRAQWPRLIVDPWPAPDHVTPERLDGVSGAGATMSGRAILRP